MRQLLIITFFLFFLLPFQANAENQDNDVNTHGMLLECDDKTRENHLYLMNAEKLGLSQDQIRQLREIKGDCDRFCVVEKARLRVAKRELNELLAKEEIDMKKAEEKIREMSELQNKLSMRHVKTKVESMMILNDEQKEKAKKLAAPQ
ncbi:MAG: periplasmic heavy metal sensor [Deltaproteobacteria bacterium]|nr:periplasmic heavy metal sensor [Deltaproteobacteria bacterium]